MSVDPDILRETLSAKLGATGPDATATIGRDRVTVAARAEVSSKLAGLPTVTIGGDDADFRLEERIGEGGMGIVHAARQRALDREVAIKRLRDGNGSLMDRAALFREARITGRLEHPNVVPVHGLAYCEGIGPVVIMKRVRGEPMKARLATLDRADGAALAEQVGVLIQVCDAVEHAHRRGIVHRDLKPENVLLGDHGEVYVVDWGVALDVEEIVDAELLVGTPAYMAPEMVDVPSRVDERSDVYLLGGILHEILTGRPPHSGPTAVIAMLLATSRQVRIDDPSLPEELIAICERACTLDPGERHPSAASLRDALQGYLEHRSAAHLASAAHGELTEVLATLDAPDPDHAAALERLDHLWHVFQSALELWPRSPRALDGLDALLGPMLRCQIALGNLPAARRLAERAKERIDPALGAQLEALEVRRDEEERARRHIQELERERDLAVGRESRRTISLLLAGVLGAVTVGVLGARGGNEPGSPRFLFTLAVLISIPVGIAVFGMRRRLLANFVNRFTMGSVLACFAGLVLHRGLALVAGHPGLTIIQQDLVLITVLIGVGGIVHRGFVIVAAIALAGAISAYVAPMTARIAINVVPVLVALGLYLMWRRLRFSEHTLVERMVESAPRDEPREE